MTEFAYNNMKSTSTNHTSFNLNYKYYPCIFYKEDIDLCFKSKLVDKLSIQLKKFITIC